ncbi:hypothetical protein QTH87_02605 [Variovorax sp. J22P168]|uniref:hypothetical protein n=1 Tax=Variovorax jilinensis TaxID=3053513 RepID=UPI0025760F34|nr:hypothetical protein [Variovorax sp. J22P168]MDM0011320.1 hypothetical protein [Variovorax sp. J22P168]
MKIALRTCLAALLTTASLAATAPAFAADPPGSLPCDGVLQDKAACLRERGAAAQMNRQAGSVAPDAATLQQNALARCARQPASDREACEARVTGAGATEVRGSVLGGGVVRTTETPIR